MKAHLTLLLFFCLSRLSSIPSASRLDGTQIFQGSGKAAFFPIYAQWAGRVDQRTISRKVMQYKQSQSLPRNKGNAKTPVNRSAAGE
jgi:hypothetical protein